MGYRYHSPRIRLVTVPHHPKQQTATIAIEEDILPPLLLVLLAGLDTKQPTRRRIVLVFVCVVRFKTCCSGESAGVLLAEALGGREDLQASVGGGEETCGRGGGAGERHC